MIATCRFTLLHLGDHVDGALAADDEAALRAHLATCPACTTFLAGYAGTARVVAAATDAAPEAAVLDRGLARVSGASSRS